MKVGKMNGIYRKLSIKQIKEEILSVIFAQNLMHYNLEKIAKELNVGILHVYEAVCQLEKEGIGYLHVCGQCLHHICKCEVPSKFVCSDCRRIGCRCLSRKKKDIEEEPKYLKCEKSHFGWKI